MEYDDDLINETHILVLRKDLYSKRLVVCEKKLNFADQEKLDSLEELLNTEIDGPALYQEVINRKLRYLCNKYDFCPNVSGSYQSCPMINAHNVPRKAQDFFKELRTRAIAYSLEKAYEKCEADPAIFAYSSRKKGGHGFQVTVDSLTFNVFYNFGYGYCNMFTIQAHLRNISLNPYDFPKQVYMIGAYPYSGPRPFLKCYSAYNAVWRKAFDYIALLVDIYLKDPSGLRLVSRIIDEKVKEFHEIIALSDDDKITLKWNPGNAWIMTKPHDVINGFKAEAICSMLDFYKEIRRDDKFKDLYIRHSVSEAIRSVREDIILSYNNLKDLLEKDETEWPKNNIFYKDEYQLAFDKIESYLVRCGVVKK